MSDGSLASHKMLQRLAETRAAKENEQQQLGLREYADCVPDVEQDSPGLSDGEKRIDEFIEAIAIADAYKRYGGQSNVSVSKEETKVRCPNPQHEDLEPSCSINNNTKVFYCFKCNVGGDIYVLAALYKGFPIPVPKDQFRNLKDSILADYGYVAMSDMNGTYLTKIVPGLAPLQPETELVDPDNPQPFFRDEGRLHDSIDWRSIIPDNTFIRSYLETASRDDCPEEFHFWNALVAVSCAAGRMRTIKEAKPVFPNLFICLTGPSGSFKSKAKYWLTELLKDALPYDPTDEMPRGVKMIKGVQSGEALVHSFIHQPIDPVTSKPMVQPNGSPYTLPVVGLIDFEEFAAIASRTQRSGSTLETYLMDIYENGATLESTGLKNPARAIMPSGSVICTTQTKSIRTVVSAKDANSGFLNKFTFVTGVQKKPFAINTQELDFTRASGLLRLIRAHCDTQKSLPWDQDANDHYTKVFETVIDPDKRKNIDNDIFQRIDLLLKKIALLFAINENTESITLSIIERVLTMYDHVKETYGIIEEQVAATEAGDNQEYLRKKVLEMTVLIDLPSGEKAERGPTPRELFHKVKGKISNLSDLKRMLLDMSDTGILFHQVLPPGPKGGPRTNRYTVAH